MDVLQTFTSPDGFLKLLVVRSGEDISIGFDGSDWHTHPDIIAYEYGVPEEQAVDWFVREVTGNRLTIAVSRVAGGVRAVWITDNPSDELRHLDEGETIQFRKWDGSEVIHQDRPSTSP